MFLYTFPCAGPILFVFVFVCSGSKNVDCCKIFTVFLQFWFVCYFLCVSRTTVCKTYIVVIFKQFVCMRGATVFFISALHLGLQRLAKRYFLMRRITNLLHVFVCNCLPNVFCCIFLCNLSVFLFLS